MQKILVISNWYPVHRNDSPTRKTYAIHNLIRHWDKKISLKVISIDDALPVEYKEENIDDVDVCAVKIFLPFGRPTAKTKLKILEIMRFSWANFKNSIISGRGIFYNWFSNKKALKLLKKQLFVEWEPDIIIIHGCRSLYFLDSMKELNKKKKILVFHNSDLRRKEETTWHLKHRDIDAIGYRSKNLKKKMCQEIPYLMNYRTQLLVESGINQNQIVMKDVFFRTINREKISVLTVANLIKRKNIDKILEQIKGKEFISLDIIGDGPDAGKLKKKVQDNNLDVRFLGYLKHDQILETMKKYDLFILLSENETFGLVYLEALASGLIVIGAKNEGIDGVIINGENGFLIPLNNIEQLSNLLDIIHEKDDIFIDRIKEASYQTIQTYTEKQKSMLYLNSILALESSTI